MVVGFEGNTSDAAASIAYWEGFPVSTISDHGEQCCRIAREWFIGTDFSQLGTGDLRSGPRWLRKKFKWGPSRWPLYWCEAGKEKTLDCGALAALSHQLLLGRGVSSYPAQLILKFNDVSASHWKATWREAGSSSAWIHDGMIYHEGCAVEEESGGIKIWDATATWWINPKQFHGYAGLLALRLYAPSPTTFTWGEERFAANTWHTLKLHRCTSALPRARREEELPVPTAAGNALENTMMINEHGSY